ncbi:MAG: prolyl oligopeptidase family serine peptidase, partial [Acidothermus sp.]|nr:prolyl oligopeptidase family serine peptidase [Acidothermus sp.]
MTLPRWARRRPARSVFTCNASGTVEVYVWDRDADHDPSNRDPSSRAVRQLTRRPAGTYLAAIEPLGEWVWWFDDEAGNEFGMWRRQRFDSSPDDPADRVPLDPAYPAGLALAADGTAVLGRCTDAATSIHLVRPDGTVRELFGHVEDGEVAAVRADGTLLALAHAEHGDARHKAVRVVALENGEPRIVADLWDGPELGLVPVDFSPLEDDPRVLLLHERRGRLEPLLWNPLSGEQFDPELDLPGEVYAEWYPDATALLIGHDFRARTELFRYDLTTRSLTRVASPRGTITGATARPGGVVEFLWSSSATPPVVLNDRGGTVIEPPGPKAPPSVPAEDAWVDGPGGRIHALICRPRDAGPPFPTVFLVHGGPASHDADAFSPLVAAWVDAGFAVVRVNYRGSSGYGRAWRDAIEHRPGLTELEDLQAVRD